MIKTQNLGNLKTIITLDPLESELIQQLKTRGLQLIEYSEVLAAGEKQLQKYADVKGDDVFTFSYTSGTTGQSSQGHLPAAISRYSFEFAFSICAILLIWL